MSHGFHQGIFSFSDELDHRPTSQAQHNHQVHHIPNQAVEAAAVYDSSSVVAAGGTNSMLLSDMFNFATAAGPSAAELLASQIYGGYSRLPPRLATGVSSGFHQHPVMGLNADSAAAMQLFLMNPSQSPPPPSQPAAPPAVLHPQGFQSFGEAPFGGGIAEGQGLSLSLSSSLQQLDMEGKSDELRFREGIGCCTSATTTTTTSSKIRLSRRHHTSATPPWTW
ncbi:hypothetical protein Cni_G04312 [Canna indica]|uniref:Uncharacterized protein n=1 Tax=Canna indica TaxID=4628 RepID=A0AAQ3Q3V2_9LILI|nr:hypothetical protein Cni_G04312 [Canna indica]